MKGSVLHRVARVRARSEKGGKPCRVRGGFRTFTVDSSLHRRNPGSSVAHASIKQIRFQYVTASGLQWYGEVETWYRARFALCSVENSVSTTSSSSWFRVEGLWFRVLGFRRSPRSKRDALLQKELTQRCPGPSPVPGPGRGPAPVLLERLFSS